MHNRIRQKGKVAVNTTVPDLPCFAGAYGQSPTSSAKAPTLHALSVQSIGCCITQHRIRFMLSSYIRSIFLRFAITGRAVTLA